MSTISFELKAKEAEAMYALLGRAQGSELHPDPGVPYAVYELRMTLKANQQEPEEDIGNSPIARAKYCVDHDLTREYFPKSVRWEFPRYLLDVLKLALKDSMALQNGASMEFMIELCDSLRLNGWFKKNFKRPVAIRLEDDCDLDDEIDEDEKKEAGESTAAAAD